MLTAAFARGASGCWPRCWWSARVFVAVQVAALVLGLWLGLGVDGAARQSLETARLAVVGSIGAVRRC